MPAIHQPIPNLRHLRGFVAVDETGGVAAAAARIGLSQPALTQGIRGLERWAGIALVRRVSAGLALTEPGVILRERAERALRFLERGVAAVGARRRLAGRLSAAHLKALAATVEQGGIRPAARALGCQPSSVSRACRDLEKTLGVTLFDAPSRGLRADARAQELARAARLAFAEIAQGRDDINAWRGRVTGLLRVGSLPLAQAAIVPRAVARFAAEYPLIACSVADGYYPGLARALRRAEIDLIVGALRGDDLPEDLVQTELFSDPLAVVARRGHPLEGRRALRPADLARFGWVAPREGAPARAYFEGFVQRLPQSAPPLAAIETGAHSVMRGLLRATDRVTLVSLSQVRDEIAHGLLCALDIELPDSARPIGVTARRGWLPGLAQRRFLEVLEGVVEEMRARTPAEQRAALHDPS